MSRPQLTWLLLAWLVCLSPCFGAGPAGGRRDAFGDSLPEGAVVRLGTCRLRGGSEWTDIAMSPDGKSLLTCEHGRVQLWDMTTGQRRRLLEVQGTLRGVCFAPGGRYVALGEISRSAFGPGISRPARLLDLEEGRVIHTLDKDDGAERPLGFTPDGRRVLTHGNGKVVWWDVSTGKEVRRIEEDLLTAALSPDGTLLAGIDAGGTAVLWDGVSGKKRHAFSGRVDVPSPERRSLTFAPPPDLAWSRDGTRVAAVPVAGAPLVSHLDIPIQKEHPRIFVWEAATGKSVADLGGHEDRLRSGVTLAPNGKYLFSRDWSERSAVWDVDAGKVLPGWGPDKESPGKPVGFTHDGKAFIELVGHNLEVRSCDTGKLLKTWEGHFGTVPRVEALPDGKTFLVPGQAPRWWDMETGRELFPSPGHRHAVVEAVFAADGKRLASRDADGGLAVWDPATGKAVSPWGPHLLPGVHAVAFQKEGNLLSLLHADGKAAVWDVAAGRRERSFTVGQGVAQRHKEKPPPEAILESAFVNQGRGLVVLHPRRVCVWDLTSGKRTAELTSPHGGTFWHLQMTPDGSLVAANVGDAHVQVWDAKNRRRTLEVAATEDRPVAAFCLSPDGRFAAWGQNTAIVVHNLTRGRELASWSGGEAYIRVLGFADDGASLVSVSGERCQVWDVGTRKCLADHKLPYGDAVTILPVPGPERALIQGRIATKRWGLWLAGATSGKLLAVVHPSNQQFAVSADGKWIALDCSQGGGGFQLHDARTGDKVAGVMDSHQGELTCWVFSPGGRRLVTGSADTTLLVWDMEQLRPPPEK